MTCRRCLHEFCWLCQSPMGHSISAMNGHSCNRYAYEEKEKTKESARAALQKFLHYCNRFVNHNNSLELENKLFEIAKLKMQQLQDEHKMSWIEVQFLKQAVHTLCQCRQTLMYTYAFAYYLAENNQQVIFEDNQQDLENSTEKFSRFLENDLDNDERDPGAIKLAVVNNMKYCEARRKALIAHVKEGYDKHWWNYTEP